MKFRVKFNNLSIDSKVNRENLDTENDIVKEFFDSLNELKKEIKKIKDYKKFIKENITDLELLKETLIGNIYKTSTYSKKLSDKLLNYHNAIFISIKYNDYFDENQKLATEIFKEFAKGITYFSDEFQALRRPVYHRNVSCGSSRVVSERKFSKTLYGPNNEGYVQRCYIERLLYDKIFNHLVGMQNLNHMFELQTIKNIYDKYFPYKNIIMSVDFDDDFPVILTINIYDEKRVECVYIFRKKLNNKKYEDVVNCYKNDMLLKKEEFYEQTFDSTSKLFLF